MIAMLEGTLAAVSLEQAVVMVGGVGYAVNIPVTTRSRLGETGSRVTLYTHLHVREDALTLYGFATPAERDLFELLLTVSGVGPRVALGILSGAAPRDFLAAVVYEDVAALTRLPGVGRKIAQRLVLELRDKVGAMWEKRVGAGEIIPAQAPATGAPRDNFSEAVEALVALGYNRAQAARAVEKAAAAKASGVSAVGTPGAAAADDARAVAAGATGTRARAGRGGRGAAAPAPPSAPSVESLVRGALKHLS